MHVGRPLARRKRRPQPARKLLAPVGGLTAGELLEDALGRHAVGRDGQGRMR